MTAESRRDGSRTESNLSLELKARGKGRAQLCGAGHGPLCGPLHPDPLLHAALGLFHFEMPKVNASLCQNGTFGRRNICVMGCASSFGGAWTPPSASFFGRGSMGISWRRKEKAASTKQSCPGAGAALRIIFSRRSFLSQICSSRVAVSPADRDLTPVLARRKKDFSLPVRKGGEMPCQGASSYAFGTIAPQQAAWWETLCHGKAEKPVLNLDWDLTCLAGVSILYSMYIAAIFFF